MPEQSAEHHEPAKPQPDTWGFDRETREEISTLRTAIAHSMEEVGASDGDVISLSTLEGQSMTIASDMRPPLGGQMEAKRRIAWRRSKSTAAERVYTVKLPVTPTSPARMLTIRPALLDGSKRVMTTHGAHTFSINNPLDGAELRQTVDEATHILADPMTITLGDDALIASEQLQPCDTIRGQEARDIYDMVAPVISETLDIDPRLERISTHWAVYTDLAPPGFEIRAVQVTRPGDPDPEHRRVQTSIYFAGNPFGEEGIFSAHVNSTHDRNGELTDADVSYFQDPPRDTDRLTMSTAIALDPAERMRVAEAIQRQVIPANLTHTPPDAR